MKQSNKALANRFIVKEFMLKFWIQISSKM